MKKGGLKARDMSVDQWVLSLIMLGVGVMSLAVIYVCFKLNQFYKVIL